MKLFHLCTIVTYSGLLYIFLGSNDPDSEGDVHILSTYLLTLQRFFNEFAIQVYGNDIKIDIGPACGGIIGRFQLKKSRDRRDGRVLAYLSLIIHGLKMGVLI